MCKLEHKSNCCRLYEYLALGMIVLTTRTFLKAFLALQTITASSFLVLPKLLVLSILLLGRSPSNGSLKNSKLSIE